MTLRKIHRLSATVVLAFALVHIANHVVALAGAPLHIAFMNSARSIYRIPAVEAILLAAVAVQVVSGSSLVIVGWKQRQGFVAWLQAIAGLYLALFLMIHVGAVLSGRALFRLDTNFYFAAAGFHVRPFQWFFAPYYFLAVVALFSHVACATYWHMPNARRNTIRLAMTLPIAVGFVLALLIVMSFAGAFFPVDVPAEYKRIYPASSR